jgi:hypothetical protein
MNRLLLDSVVNELKREDTESEKFWLVLSALRGPDKEFDANDYFCAVKRATTGIIRHTIGIETRIGFASCGIAVNRDDEINAHLRRCLTSNDKKDKELQETVGEHFIDHAVKAFRVLGLSWDKVNQ